MNIEHINEDEFIWSATSLTQDETNLPVIIIATNHQSYSDELGPRLRVLLSENYDPYNMVAISISDNPIVLSNNIDKINFDNITQFIKLNYDALLKMWNDQKIFTSFDLFDSIKVIS